MSGHEYLLNTYKKVFDSLQSLLFTHCSEVWIIVTLQNSGFYEIDNQKAMSCSTRANWRHYTKWPVGYKFSSSISFEVSFLQLPWVIALQLLATTKQCENVVIITSSITYLNHLFTLVTNFLVTLFPLFYIATQYGSNKYNTGS